MKVCQLISHLYGLEDQEVKLALGEDIGTCIERTITSVEGYGFDEDGVVLYGVPLNNNKV